MPACTSAEASHLLRVCAGRTPPLTDHASYGCDGQAAGLNGIAARRVAAFAFAPLTDDTCVM